MFEIRAFVACSTLGVTLAFVPRFPLGAADTAIAYEVPEDTVGNQTDFAGSVGLDFDVILPISVTRLGVFDSGSDGMGLTITARLFNRDTFEDLGSLQFTPADPGDLVGGSRFKALAVPVALPAGFHGTISAEGYGEDEPLGNQGRGPLVLGTNNGGCAIAFVGTGRYGDPGAFPATPDAGPSNIYAAGTFEFPIPPPSPTPGTPVHFVAKPGDKKVDLTWEDTPCGTPAAMYRVFRAATLADAFAQIAEVPGTSFTDTGLPNDVSLCYFVRAVSAAGDESDDSPRRCTLPRAPSPPYQVVATDDTSDPEYADDWQGLSETVPSEQGMDNGGDGFEPWDFAGSYWVQDPLQSPYAQPHFIDVEPSSFNDLGGPAFALTNGNVPYGGFATIATRVFTRPLNLGDRISVDIDNPLMKWLPGGDFDSTGFIVSLQTSADGDGNGKLDERFGLYTYKGFNNDEWTITDGRGASTGSGLTDVAGSVGFHFAFTQTGDETYQLTLTPSVGDELSVEGELAIVFVIYGNGSGDGVDMPTGERELYFNNLLVESVPSSVQRPGDENQDGKMDLSDAVSILNYLFTGTNPSLACGDGTRTDAANLALLDANGDAKLDLSDPVSMLKFLFSGGPPPVYCAGDPTCRACITVPGCPDNRRGCGG
jgi:hypothetical protein